MSEPVPRTPPDDSRRLLVRARGGDDSSLWRLTETYRPYLKGVVAQVLGQRLQTRLDDSDVVQQAMTAAIANFGTFGGATLAEWQAWLSAIARNEARAAGRYWRRVCRDAGRDVAAPMDLLHQDEAQGDEQALRIERADGLLKAIDRLSVQDQQIIGLRNFEGLSHKQIAECLSISEDASRQRWSKALSRLRNALKDEP